RDLMNSDFFEDILSVFIAILIIFLFPLLYFTQKQDSLIQTMVSIKTEKLLDEVTGKGYLTKERYDEFLRDLSSTGLMYEIALEHEQKSYEPEYRFRTAEEIIEGQNSAYAGKNTYTYNEVTSKIPVVVDPIDNSGLTMNTETNASILAASLKTSNPGHIHTEECFAGHIHKGSKVCTASHQHTSNCRQYLFRCNYKVNCYSCGSNYIWTAAVYYWDDTAKRAVYAYSDTNGINRCINCGYSYPNAVQKNEYAYSCGYNIDLDGDGYFDPAGVSTPQIYTSSGPLSSEKKDYSSGCYAYHQHLDFSSTEAMGSSPYYGSFFISPGSAYYNLYGKGIQSFCTIPEYYTIKNQSCYTDYYVSLTFKAVYSGGTVTMYFSSGSNVMGSCPPLSWSEFYDLASSESKLASFLWKYFGSDYGKMDNSISALSGSISVCDNIHPNRWVTTCGLIEDATVICERKVVSMVPTKIIQAVYVNEALITTAVVTYQNGSSETVICNTSFSTSVPVKNQPVTINYTDITGKTIISTLTVTVVPRTMTCTNGHIYNLNNDGTDPGCLYCKSYVRTLSIEYPLSGNITIYRGTTLTDNDVTIRAIYMDGHIEFLTSEYVDNLDKFYVGTQTVTISYKGKYLSLTVNTRRNMMLCSICRRYYELYPDDSDPGCPYCAARTPIFTGNVLEYNSKTYAKEILKELYEGSGIYYFALNDHLSIKIESSKGSFGSRLVSFLFKGFNEKNIHITDGRYIREDGSEE
ncbi:MAG: hypothetical protein WBI07_03525, partial [Mobilitalea sp.]